MITSLIAAVIAALALSGGLGLILFWQLKRGANAQDAMHNAFVEVGVLRLALASCKVANADKAGALNMVTAERDRLEFALDTVKDQRDELLQEAFDGGRPGAVASAVRDALRRISVQEEALPDLPNT